MCFFLPRVNAYLSLKWFWKKRRIVYIYIGFFSYYNSMFTYTIGRINILNFHRCRCVSNTILTTHTNITDNRRLNQTKLNICWVLLRSYNYFLLNRKRKKNSCTVQFFSSPSFILYIVYLTVWDCGDGDSFRVVLTIDEGVL